VVASGKRSFQKVELLSAKGRVPIALHFTPEKVRKSFMHFYLKVLTISQKNPKFHILLLNMIETMMVMTVLPVVA
jgi:hypothetical protein